MDLHRLPTLRLPERIRAMDIEPAAPVLRETSEEREEREALARRHNLARYERRLPRRYKSAALTDLTPAQDVNGHVSSWLDAGHQTLLLASTTPGNGKTHSAYAVCRTAIDRQMWVEAWVVMDLLAELRPGGEAEVIDDAIACDLLLLDDLGRERISDWTTEQVHRVLNHRLAEGRRTIITTNLTHGDMLQRYTEPLVDRVMDDAVIIRVTGETRRRQAEF